MKCPRCQQENRFRAKFCLECSTPLLLRCSNCGTQLLAAAKFCLKCDARQRAWVAAASRRARGRYAEASPRTHHQLKGRAWGRA